MTTQLDVLRAMTPVQRLAAATRLYWTAREIKAAALRARHPDWTEDDIKRAVTKAFSHVRG